MTMTGFFMKPTIMNFPLIIIISLVNAADPTIKVLEDENWSPMLEGEWMVEFIAPWCPACQQLDPIWLDFSKDISINVGRVDITKNPALSGRFGITTLPTIFHVKDAVFRQYRGSKDKESFKQFVIQEQWKKLDPLPFWKSPQSFLMSLYAYLYRLSVWITHIYHMMIDFGIPVWGTIVIFAVLTILLGGFIGLQIVLIIDNFSHIYRSKSESSPDQKSKQQENSSNESFESNPQKSDEFLVTEEDPFESESEDDDDESNEAHSQSDDEEGLLRRRYNKEDV